MNYVIDTLEKLIEECKKDIAKLDGERDMAMRYYYDGQIQALRLAIELIQNNLNK